MKKKLKRDQEQAIVSGVLAGMANYWNQDPVLFRVLAIVFLVLTGFFPGGAAIPRSLDCDAKR